MRRRMLKRETEAERIQRLFTGRDGRFRFARWAQPLAPAVFNADGYGAKMMREALGGVAKLGGLWLAESDPRIGANVYVFFCDCWDEAREAAARRTPPSADLCQLAPRLFGVDADCHRAFGFDASGAIRLCALFIRDDAESQRLKAQTTAAFEALRSILLWSEDAFAEGPPVDIIAAEERATISQWHADLVRAAYDPSIPAASTDPAQADRIAARMRALREARRW